MAWAKKQFKNKSKVWVRVDDQGDPISEDGRVEMRYSDDEDAKIYSASVRNISDMDSTSTAQKAASTRTVSFRETVWRDPAGPVSASREMPASLESLDPPPDDVWEFFTDGACSGNPGPCGWGLLLRRKDSYYEANQYIGVGTNNIAELMAIKEALVFAIVEDPKVHVHTDSSYAIGVLTKGWKAKKNSELIHAIRDQLRRFSETPRFIKVKGHSGHPLNERADFLATSAIEGISNDE